MSHETYTLSHVVEHSSIPTPHTVDSEDDIDACRETFIYNARLLNEKKRNPQYFGLGKDYEKRIKREFWEGKKIFNVKSRRDSRQYLSEMAVIEEESNLKPYFSLLTEPQPLVVTGEEVTHTFQNSD
jgi:hypothetical protein